MIVIKGSSMFFLRFVSICDCAGESKQRGANAREGLPHRETEKRPMGTVAPAGRFLIPLYIKIRLPYGQSNPIERRYGELTVRLLKQKSSSILTSFFCITLFFSDQFFITRNGLKCAVRNYRLRYSY